jgi:hypothetical protein
MRSQADSFPHMLMLATPLLNYLLAAYCLHRAYRSIRWRTEASSLGQRLGQEFGRGARVVGLLAGAAGLVYLWPWMVTPAVVLLTASLPQTIRRMATDFAQGRKSAELACSREYVSGRAAPTSLDVAIGIVLATPFYLAPIVLMILTVGRM